jgi:fibrillarin-like rRNA methylase
VPIPKTNTDALLFFEKMGYEEVAVKSNSIDGNVDANVIMTKKLKGKQMRSAETEGNAKGTCLLDRFAHFFGCLFS